MRVLGTEPESSVRAIRILTMELSLRSLYCFSKNKKKDQMWCFTCFLSCALETLCHLQLPTPGLANLQPSLPSPTQHRYLTQVLDSDWSIDLVLNRHDSPKSFSTHCAWRSHSPPSICFPVSTVPGVSSGYLLCVSLLPCL